jgi:aldehyde dehydrogenase (NAD+)
MSASDPRLVLSALDLAHVLDEELDEHTGHALRSPIDGASLGRVRLTPELLDEVAARAAAASSTLKAMPMPVRGQVVRALGEAIARKKTELGRLITLEVGKIRSEAEGEIQEIVDVCDYACGLSRSIGGQTLSSERPLHRLNERWHPLGPVLCITAFNFPAAVWGWNAALAIVCGDPIVWKPSLKAPLTALAVHAIAADVFARFNIVDASQLVLVDDAGAAQLVADARFALVSATGSTRMGQAVASTVAHTIGRRTLLELGGNNALVVLNDADLDLAVRAVVFGAFGTAGQRCTSTRRLLVQRGIAAAFTERVVRATTSLRIGNPFDDATLVGPLIDTEARDRFAGALERVRSCGGEVLCGGVVDGVAGGAYVQPAVVRSPRTSPMVREELFGPLLHVIEIDDVDDAIAVNNASDHGLSSAIFTCDLRAAERFVDGSDCGLCNVNTGTSGAEIGGAFGGEKHTGGGRESGSDSWKQYMRRQTSAVNYGDSLPLAQGVRFDA